MAVKRLLQIRPQYDDGNGALASNYRLFFYAAGSSTKQNTYNSSSGGVANTNPIVLNALGEPSVEVWGTVGQTYKIGLAIAGTDDPPASFIWSEDNVAPINDTTVSVDQWVSGPAPTYVSAVSFTLVGDQTSTFHVGRRVKTTNTGGTVYSTISAAAYGALTTITVVNDSSTLDSGLSAVSYGLASATNPSTPLLSDAYPIVSGSADPTKKIRVEADGITTATTRVVTVPDSDVTLPIINLNSTRAANLVLAGPSSGGAAIPAFRQLVPADTGFSQITNSLSGDTALNNTGNYFDGPTIAQGTSGTWWVAGKVTLQDTSGAANFAIKLWDGTTVIDSAEHTSSGAGAYVTVALSGYLASPAASIRISVKDTSSTSGLIKFNASGNSKDSTLNAFRIA